jgi:hypothetical protein
MGHTPRRIKMETLRGFALARFGTLRHGAALCGTVRTSARARRHDRFGNHDQHAAHCAGTAVTICSWRRILAPDIGAGYWGRTAIQRVCNDLLTMLRSVVIASKDIPKTFFVRLNAEFTAWFLR